MNTEERDERDELARMEALLRAAAAPRLPDRARFADRVMRRVHESPRRVLQPAAPLPWWVQAFADPAAALACALLALLLWRPEALTALAGLASGATDLLVSWGGGLPFRSDRPALALGLGLVAVLAVGWASLHLYRWTERTTRRVARL